MSVPGSGPARPWRTVLLVAGAPFAGDLRQRRHEAGRAGARPGGGGHRRSSTWRACAGRAGPRASASAATTCSLGEPQQVTLSLENLTRQGRRAAAHATTCRRPSRPTRPSFASMFRAAAASELEYRLVPGQARDLCLRAGRCPGAEPAGALAAVGVVAGADGGPRLSRRPPDRPVHHAGPPRPAQRAGPAEPRGGWGPTTSSSGCATTSRATTRGTWTGGPRPAGGS